MLTDVQTPFLGTPLVPSRVTRCQTGSGQTGFSQKGHKSHTCLNSGLIPCLNSKRCEHLQFGMYCTTTRQRSHYNYPDVLSPRLAPMVPYSAKHGGAQRASGEQTTCSTPAAVLAKGVRPAGSAGRSMRWRLDAPAAWRRPVDAPVDALAG